MLSAEDVKSNDNRGTLRDAVDDSVSLAMIEGELMYDIP